MATAEFVEINESIFQVFAPMAINCGFSDIRIVLQESQGTTLKYGSWQHVYSILIMDHLNSKSQTLGNSYFQI
ncbi:hypothetical protein AB0305_01365 [Arthrobacter sp. NPDC080086]|uniref:hypothetical protein n=1 Tax=Arthrobacter sp. NPDC080086 TaxID=3155917 RepID=UPI003450C4B2